MNFRTPLLTALIYLPALSGISPSQTPAPPAWSYLEDADQDGMTDVNEILLGLDPLNPADGLSDLDGDGLSLAWEFAIGTHASLADTDADGWSDSEEYLTHGTDPRDWLSFPLTSSSPNAIPPIAAPLPASVAATPPPPPPPPSLSNGDFSVQTFSWRSGQTYKDYQGRGFDWGQGTVSGWRAYIGTTVEVWKSGTETFVELDGTSTSHGIKQDIANVVPGHYALVWKQCGRTNNLAGDNNYKVKIYYTPVANAAPITISESAEFKAIDKTKWTDNAHSFLVTAAQIAAASGKITVAFIPTGTLNTYGTLIDQVKLIPVEFKKMWETKNMANQIVVKAKRDDPKDDKQTADADGNLYGTPRYLLYVTADPSDSKYHVSLDCELGGLRDQFVCAAYSGGSKINGTDKAFPAAADQPADLLIPATGSDQSGQDFVIKLAFDADKNGLIGASEPLIDLTAAKSETGSPAPPMIRGFSVAAVDAAKNTIHGQATGSGFTGWKPNFLGKFFVPNAQALERLFYDGATGGMAQEYQPTTTLSPANLDAFGPPGDFNEWLTHHAGSNFNADGVTTVQHYYWNPSKRISSLIANSSPLSLLKSNSTITAQMTSVTDATVENFKQSSISVGQSQTFPSGASGYDLQTVLAGLGVPHSSPSWVPKQTLLVGDQDGYAGEIPDDAFGTVGRSRFINGEYRFIVRKEERTDLTAYPDGSFTYTPYTAVVVYLRISGSSQDLYDFNHNSGALSVPAAITQLSYGNGGYGRTNGVIFRATVDILKDYEVKEIRLP